MSPSWPALYSEDDARLSVFWMPLWPAGRCSADGLPALPSSGGSNSLKALSLQYWSSYVDIRHRRAGVRVLIGLCVIGVEGVLRQLGRHIRGEGILSDTAEAIALRALGTPLAKEAGHALAWVPGVVVMRRLSLVVGVQRDHRGFEASDVDREGIDAAALIPAVRVRVSCGSRPSWPGALTMILRTPLFSLPSQMSAGTWMTG